MHGSMGGGWKPGMVRRVRHCQTKEAATDGPHLQPRRQSSTLPKLKGPGRWNYFCLYIILDIFSRFVVGWTVADRESAQLARDLIDQACAQQRIEPGQLTIHADRGSAMTSKPVSQLLLDLDVVRTHSRPHVSNDNPYSESHFKTLKYQPQFPDRFGCEEDARGFCRTFVPWYNVEHRHSGICMLTPATVHYGHAQQVLHRRHTVLLRAYQAHPDRFSHTPRPAELPSKVWINKPNT